MKYCINYTHWQSRFVVSSRDDSQQSDFLLIFAQIILEKFEFFPVKCKIQRSVEIFSAKRDEILNQNSYKIKVNQSQLY